MIVSSGFDDLPRFGVTAAALCTVFFADFFAGVFGFSTAHTGAHEAARSVER
jgi:hypothetical protein